VRRADNFTISCADCLEICEPQPSGILRNPGLEWDCFSYYSMFQRKHPRLHMEHTNTGYVCVLGGGGKIAKNSDIRAGLMYIE
jgi:hypothetical protein